MTLLVTGAMGHVGYELVARAARRGMKVLALYRGGFRAADAAALGPDVQWERCDLADAATVRRLVASRAVDACIHTAAVTNEAYAKPDPMGAVRSNIDATATLLEAARVGRWRRFILVSTGSVFQHATELSRPILEDHPPACDSVYAATKRAAEMLCEMYRASYGVPAATVRLSWVFGPPIISDAPTRGPIPSYLLRALRGEKVQEDGGAFAVSFTYVADAAEGLLAATSAPELRHPIYHLGHGVNFTARQAAEAVRAAVPGAVLELGGGTEPWTRFTSLRGPLAGERLKADTGFAPAYSLEAVVAAYAQWLRAHPEAWRAPACG